MADYSFRNRISKFLGTREVEETEAVTEFIDECLVSGIGADPEPSLPGQFEFLIDKCRFDLDCLDKGQHEAQRKNILSQMTLDAIARSRAGLARGFDVDSVKAANSFRKLRSFFSVTGFAQDDPMHGTFRFGTRRHDWRSPASTFMEGLYNLPNGILPPPSLRQRFCSFATDQAEDGSAQCESLESDLTAYHADLRQYVRDVIRAAEQHSGSWFLNLPKAEQFYLNIRSLFCPDEAGFLPDIYVFSTTSGLVIREQYLGSNQMKTSPWRRDYFDFFRTSGCRIYYQLDPFSTWAGEKGVLRSQMPVETHQEHLASFLQIPNLELSEVAFDLAETIWRREYTVVSSRGEVAFSSRSPDVKEISEGLIATKKFYEQTGKDPFRTIQSMYDHQISEKQIIKKMHEHLTAEESRQRAAETFRRWHLDMRTAV